MDKEQNTQGFEKPLTFYSISNNLSRVFKKPLPSIIVDIVIFQNYNKHMDMKIADVLSCSIGGFRLPRYHELPNQGLYLEQTTQYINQCLRPLGFEDVTSSMIRNYVKQGIVNNPVQKRYYVDQIAHLIPLALLKQVTPLENVNALFAILHRNGKYTNSVAYDYFCEELENILHFRFGLKDSIADVGVTSSLEKEMLRSTITAVSHIVYLNRCFQYLTENQRMDNNL